MPADRDRSFDKSFGAFFDLLDDDAVSVAAHTARLAGPIAAARPDPEPRITRRLLALDGTRFDPTQRDLVKTCALEAVEVTIARRSPRGDAEVSPEDAVLALPASRQGGEGVPQEASGRLMEEVAAHEEQPGTQLGRLLGRLPVGRTSSNRTPPSPG